MLERIEQVLDEKVRPALRTTACNNQNILFLKALYLINNFG